MDFNFDKLRQLRAPNCTSEGTAAEKAPEMPPEPLLDSRQYKSTTSNKNATQGKYKQIRVGDTNLYKIEHIEEQQAEPLPGNNMLQRQADQNAAEQERAVAAYKHYQDNIRAAGQLTTDIIKGLNTGQDIHDLFLMAVKAICCMTSDNYLYNHAEETIKTIYGVALGQQKPLELELAAVEERIYNLEEAILWVDQPDEKQRIENAIKWHKQRQEEIEKKIAEKKPQQ